MGGAFARSMVLVTVILMDILGGSEVDLFVPSFPELQEQFHLSPFFVESLLSINFIGFFCSLFFVGGLADRYGRRPIILIGTSIFIFGTMLCLYALSYHFLLIGRFLQGLGVAAPTTLCFLIVADSYPIKQQQYLIAMLNGIVNVSIGAAPVVGSYVTMYFHWQGNFVVLLILGLLVFAMTLFFIPVQALPHEKESISLRGYLPLLGSRTLMIMILCMICISAVYWVFVGISPILYMEDLGVSLAVFGYYQGVLAFLFALGSILCGTLINRFDSKRMLDISMQICLAGALIIALVAIFDLRSPLVITIAFLPYIIGTIIPAAILYPICLNYVPRAKGRISAMIQGGRLILTSCGLQVAGYFYQGSFQNIGIIITIIFFVGVWSFADSLKNVEI